MRIRFNIAEPTLYRSPKSTRVCSDKLTTLLVKYFPAAEHVICINLPLYAQKGYLEKKRRSHRRFFESKACGAIYLSGIAGCRNTEELMAIGGETSERVCLVSPYKRSDLKTAKTARGGRRDG